MSEPFLCANCEEDAGTASQILRQRAAAALIRADTGKCWNCGCPNVEYWLAPSRVAIEAEVREKSIDATYLSHQREWSERTFGPGPRAEGVVDHIRKELLEIEENPADLEEWADVIILALDGAWREGYEPQQIIDAVKSKQSRNEIRIWPDWRLAEPGKAIEHIRDVRSTP